jgi:hypothetical protein
MMRRSRARSHHQSRTRIKLTADQIRVTNEEILGDLLYPAPAQNAARPGRPRARR